MSNSAAEDDGGGARVGLLSGTVESSGPACLRVPFSLVQTLPPFATPLRPQAPRGPSAGIEDTLSSSSPWPLRTGSLIRRLFLVGKDSSVSHAARVPAWRTPGSSLVLGLLPLDLASDHGLQSCRAQMVAGWRGRLHPREVSPHKGRSWACCCAEGL